MNEESKTFRMDNWVDAMGMISYYFEKFGRPTQRPASKDDQITAKQADELWEHYYMPSAESR